MTLYQGVLLSDLEIQFLLTLENLIGSPAQPVDKSEYEMIARFGGEDEPINSCFVVEHNNIIRLAILESPISELPSNFQNLQALTQLDLVNLRNLTYLPDSIGEISNLEGMIIEYCTLIQEIPDSIGNLRNLKRLTLMGLSSLQSVPESIFKLHSLEYLNFERLNMSVIPDSIGNLTSLNDLSLNLQLLTLLPDSIQNLENLKKLTLFQCKSLTSLPNSMKTLVKLERLNLDGTPISELPDFFSNFVALRDLNIARTYISSFPEGLSNLKSLRILDVSELELTTVPDWLGNITSLRRLNLSGNQISSLPDSFKGLQNLERLDLSRCAFTSIPPVLLHLEYIERLRLKGNPFSKEEKKVAGDSPAAIRDYLRKDVDISIYISYTVDENTSEFVPKIIKWLESQSGIAKVWNRERDLEGTIEEFMQKKMLESQLFIFVATNKSVNQCQECGLEIENARKNSLSIIPIKTLDVGWEDLGNIGLSRELGKELKETEGEGFKDFLTDLSDYIHQYQSEHDLFNSEKRELEQIEADIRMLIRQFFEDDVFTRLVIDEQLKLTDIMKRARKSRRDPYPVWQELFDILKQIPV